jgi:Rrf2 family iron-sulfur cluster assembly transcriptional regulator
MQLIRQDTDYAIRALLQLALGGEETMTCHELAEACDLPKSFAYKVLKKMAKARLVGSRTGRNGGFFLRRSPHRIALTDVIKAIQGPVSVNKCVLDRSACGRSDTCPLSAQLCGLQSTIDDFLNRTTIHDVLTALNGGPPEPPKRRRRRTSAR